jgi:transcriptional regulator with XRE-family HTH domain
MSARKLEERDYTRALRLRLVQLRWRLQIDEHEAARRAGVSVASWRKWEAGTVNMQTGSFLKIGKAFSCSLDWLVGLYEVAS